MHCGFLLCWLLFFDCLRHYVWKCRKTGLLLLPTIPTDRDLEMLGNRRRKKEMEEWKPLCLATLPFSHFASTTQYFQICGPSSWFPACDDGEMMTLFDAPSVYDRTDGEGIRKIGALALPPPPQAVDTHRFSHPQFPARLIFFLKPPEGFFENWVG